MASQAALKSDAGDRSDPVVMTAAAIAAIAALTIGGAWFFQLVLDIRPCPLCLEQRYAYYFIIPLAVLITLGALRKASRPVLVAGLAALMMAAFANAVLGAYHAGVEWGMWQGPTDCSGPITDFGNMGNLLDSIKTIKVMRCDEVQWRFLGLSLAGYNALISLAMAGLALRGIGKATRSKLV